MIFEHEAPSTPLEYSANKLFVPGYPTHMYLVLDWENLILITDPNPMNSMKFL